MKKNTLFSAVLSLFLLLSASITWAQTVTITGKVYENNMVKIPFQVPEGKITVYLPDDMVPGGTVMGTVSMVPEGKNEKSRNKNLPLLEAYRLVDIAGNLILPDYNSINQGLPGERFGLSFKIPADTKNDYAVQLNDPIGNAVAISTITLIKTVPELPEQINLEYKTITQEYKEQNNGAPKKAIQNKIITADKPIVIFSVLPDRTEESTSPATDHSWQLEFENKLILLHPAAASSRQMVFAVPPGITGPCKIIEKDKEGNTVFADNFNVVSIEASMGNNNLQSREKTNLKVNVMGLKKSPYPISLVIVNKSSPVIMLEKGNHQTYFLDTAGENSGRIADNEGRRNASISQVVTGIKPGEYNISATLVLPADTYADVFEQQITELNSPEEYNAWLEALKKDLNAYAANQPNDRFGTVLKARALNALENIPLCSDMAMLGQCKAIAGAYLRRAGIPNDAARYWLSGTEAAKVAINAIAANLAGEPQLINWEMIRNRLDYFDRARKKFMDFNMGSAIENTRNLVKQAITVGETNEILQKLNTVLQNLDNHMDKNLSVLPTGMQALLPGGLLFATKFTPPGMTTLAVEITDIAWTPSPSNAKGDAIIIKWHFTNDMNVKEISARVNWVSKDGKKSSADFILPFKKGGADFKNCDTFPVTIDWPKGFKPAGLDNPPAKDKLDLDKTKVTVNVNGQKVGEGKLED
jgi:hypothetical protein